MNGKAQHNLNHICFAGKKSTRGLISHASAVNHHGTITAMPVIHKEQEEFIAWVMGSAGLDASAYRLKPLLRRLPACLRALKVPSLRAARAQLEEEPQLITKVVNIMLIGVTEFFREPDVYEVLRTEILPAAVHKNKPLRVWSAACSTGAELYSVAILLKEADLLEQSFLLGTDCRPEAIAQAKLGSYNFKALGTMDSGVRDKYFVHDGQNWQLCPQLRSHVRWQMADLLTGIKAGPWDIILWRNAAIYLQHHAATKIYRGLTAELAPQGALIVGKADRPSNDTGLTQVARCIYRA